MKKLIYTTILAASLGFNCYLYNEKQDTKQEYQKINKKLEQLVSKNFCDQYKELSGLAENYIDLHKKIGSVQTESKDVIIGTINKAPVDIDRYITLVKDLKEASFEYGKDLNDRLRRAVVQCKLSKDLDNLRQKLK